MRNKGYRTLERYFSKIQMSRNVSGNKYCSYILEIRNMFDCPLLDPINLISLCSLKMKNKLLIYFGNA